LLISIFQGQQVIFMENFKQFRSEITELFDHHGGDLYGGEAITQITHALQCAQVAEHDGAGPHLIVSGLLHDIGHLLHDEFEEAQARGQDRFHENLGSKYLEKWFGPEVTEPVRLHVASKRYLCATDPDYQAKLSPASQHTLKIQGGPMNRDEVREFAANPWYKDAIRVRFWDDLGKDPEMKTATLDHFLAYADRF
jgi:phosphonate degradation associated HDIG domain protein